MQILSLPQLKILKSAASRLNPSELTFQNQATRYFHIVDGIAHSQMVLADVSTIGHDSKTGIPYRNANVMYEVGIALACRQSSEVLLIRDDHDKFLFDVSTVPHMTLNFVDVAAARQKLHEELLSRLKERALVNDARITIAIDSLSGDEIELIKAWAGYAPGTVWGKKNDGTVNFTWMIAVPRLLEKKLIRVVGEFDEGYPGFTWTQIGQEVAARIKLGLRKLTVDSKPTDSNDPQRSA